MAREVPSPSGSLLHRRQRTRVLGRAAGAARDQALGVGCRADAATQELQLLRRWTHQRLGFTESWGIYGNI